MLKRRVYTVLVVLGLVLVVAGLYHRAQGSGNSAAAKSAEQQQRAAASFNKTQNSLTDPTSPWVIVNKQHPLQPLSYAPTDLVAIGNGQQMRAAAATAALSLFASAKKAGYSLTADSGYRSYQTQIKAYNSIVQGYSQSYADSISARPGYSEHQTGWAVDIGTGSCNVQDCFSSTAGGKWTIAHAYEYGFILRYPPGLTSITGYDHEAWHFRYVGTVLSTQLHKQGVQTLEQFFGVSGGTTYKPAS